MSVERRMSISSYLILQRRVTRSHERALEEPLRSRWYVPLLAAALALLAFIGAAVAALEIVTAGHQRPAHVTQPARAELDSRLEPGSHVEPAPDVELISRER